jgi:hypothetical protein
MVGLVLRLSIAAGFVNMVAEVLVEQKRKEILDRLNNYELFKKDPVYRPCYHCTA